METIRVPSGMTLIREGGQRMYRALVDSSPHIKKRKHLLIGEFEPVSLEEMVERERKDKTPVRLQIYQRLAAAGVPAEVLDNRYFTLPQNPDFYVNPAKAKIMLPDSVLTGLNSLDEGERTKTIVAIGSYLIRANIFSLPYRDNPYYV